jgi:hypothetical protein
MPRPAASYAPRVVFSEHDGWQRTPVEFLIGVTSGLSGEVAHAATGIATLCRIPLRKVHLTDRLFTAGNEAACTVCSERLAAIPPRQSPQELLYNEITASAPGPLRDELVEALKRGAEVSPWVMDAAADRIRSSARLHEAIEGGPEAESALRTTDRAGMAEVVHGEWRFVVIMPKDSTPVIVRRTARPKATPDRPGWSFETAREPTRFAAGITSTRPARPTGSPDDLEHAVNGNTTLCGIPVAKVVIVRHLFTRTHAPACPRCAELDAEAPRQPCTQERLHDLIQAATPGQLRDDLAAALTRGAEITQWIYGPAPSLAKHTPLDHLTEGQATVRAALQRPGRVGVAQVLHGPWHSIVILREAEPPLIARAPT